MTEMSAAAIAPTQPAIREQDRKHPLFPLYRQHRQFCSINLIEASRFDDFVYQHEQNLKSENAAKRPEYANFLIWMRSTKAGGRQCPAGCFPNNFYYWLEGGRW